MWTLNCDEKVTCRAVLWDPSPWRRETALHSPAQVPRGTRVCWAHCTLNPPWSWALHQRPTRCLCSPPPAHMNACGRARPIHLNPRSSPWRTTARSTASWSSCGPRAPSPRSPRPRALLGRPHPCARVIGAAGSVSSQAHLGNREAKWRTCCRYREPWNNNRCDCTASVDQQFGASWKPTGNGWGPGRSGHWVLWSRGSPNHWHYFPLDFLKDAIAYL